MKKVFALVVLAMGIFSSGVIAQNNVTLSFKGKADDMFFKRTEFVYSLSGFNNAGEANAFYDKMRGNSNVISVQDKGKDSQGNYSVLVTMKEPQTKSYYLNWASQLGIAYIINEKGEKKSPQEWSAAGKSSHENRTH